jgi:hypothetical protein
VCPPTIISSLIQVSLWLQQEGVFLGGVGTRCGRNAEIRRRVVTRSLTASMMMTDEPLGLFQQLSCECRGIQTVARGSPESQFRHETFLHVAAHKIRLYRSVMLRIEIDIKVVPSRNKVRQCSQCNLHFISLIYMFRLY